MIKLRKKIFLSSSLYSNTYSKYLSREKLFMHGLKIPINITRKQLIPIYYSLRIRTRLCNKNFRFNSINVK